MGGRRALLVAAAISPLGVAGCDLANKVLPGGITDPNVGKVADFISTVAGSLLSLSKQLVDVTIPGLSQSALQAANFAIASIQALAVQVSAAATTAAQQPLVQKIVTYADNAISALVPALTAGGKTTLADILQSIQVVLPTIMTLVGLFVPTMMTAKGARVSAATSIDEKQAWVILRGHQLRP